MERIELIKGTQTMETTVINTKLRFKGERLCQFDKTDRDAFGVFDVDQTLYRAANGFLIVGEEGHMEDFRAFNFQKITEVDLEPGGQFADLGEAWREVQELEPKQVIALDDLPF